MPQSTVGGCAANDLQHFFGKVSFSHACNLATGVCTSGVGKPVARPALVISTGHTGQRFLQSHFFRMRLYDFRGFYGK